MMAEKLERQRGRHRKTAPPCIDSFCVTFEGATIDYQPSGGAIGTLCIPNRLLKHWQSEHERSYVNLVNERILDEIVTIRDDARLEVALRNQGNKVSIKVRRGGRSAEEILDGNSHVFVLRGEIVPHSQVTYERDVSIEEAERYRRELGRLDGTIQRLLEEMKSEHDDYEETISRQDQQMVDLQAPLQNKGKIIDEVSPRHARRKLSDFRTNAQKALWFTNTFGLEITELHGHTHSGKPVTVPLTSNSSSQPSSHDGDNYKILQTLYLLDRFGVGDAFYHELSMLEPELARSYSQTFPC